MMSLYANNKRMHIAKAATVISMAAQLSLPQPSDCTSRRGTKAQNKANGNKKYTYHNGYSNKLWHTVMLAKAKIKKLSGRLAYLKHANTKAKKQPASHKVPSKPTSDNSCKTELWQWVNKTPIGPRLKKLADASCNNRLCDEKLPQPCPAQGLLANDNHAFCHSA